MIPLSSTVNMVPSHSPLELQSPATCAVRRHTLQTTFSVFIEGFIFFLPFSSLYLRKSKAIFFDQCRIGNIQSGYTTSVFFFFFCRAPEANALISTATI
jgi:hypothetical protein